MLLSFRGNTRQKLFASSTTLDDNPGLPEILNRSVNDTLSRTVMTSTTTLLALLALFIFGGEVIRSFCFAMIWGIVVGTYSSIFIATPVLLYLKPRQSGGSGKPAEGAGTSSGISLRRPTEGG